MSPELSIVLPCYRAAPLARRSVAELTDYLRTQSLSWEIIVVDDGGGDFEPDEWSGDAAVRLLSLPRNRGKGAALRSGLLAARGAARIFTDVDLPYDLDLIPVIARYLLVRRYHLVIGDRSLPSSSYLQEISLARRIASGVFTTLVGRLVTGGFFDTQCGLKGLRGDVTNLLLELLTVDRFAFDVELVYVALVHRLDIKRIPVRLRNNETSSVRIVSDSVRMLRDVLTLPVRRARGAYSSDALDRLVEEDFRLIKSAAESLPLGVDERA